MFMLPKLVTYLGNIIFLLFLPCPATMHCGEMVAKKSIIMFPQWAIKGKILQQISDFLLFSKKTPHFVSVVLFRNKVIYP